MGHLLCTANASSHARTAPFLCAPDAARWRRCDMRRLFCEARGASYAGGPLCASCTIRALFFHLIFSCIIVASYCSKWCEVWSVGANRARERVSSADPPHQASCSHKKPS